MCLFKRKKKPEPETEPMSFRCPKCNNNIFTTIMRLSEKDGVIEAQRLMCISCGHIFNPFSTKADRSFPSECRLVSTFQGQASNMHKRLVYLETLAPPMPEEFE